MISKNRIKTIEHFYGDIVDVNYVWSKDLRKSSEVFGNLQKILENVQKFRMPFGQHSEKRQKLRSWYVYKTNKIIHDARIFLVVFNSIYQEFANPTREIWSLACEQAPEWSYASEASCERKHLMTSSTLDDERSTGLRTGPVRSWRYFCVLKRVQGTSLTTMQMGSQIKQRPFTSCTLSSANNAGSTRDFVVFVLSRKLMFELKTIKCCDQIGTHFNVHLIYRRNMSTSHAAWWPVVLWHTYAISQHVIGCGKLPNKSRGVASFKNRIPGRDFRWSKIIAHEWISFLSTHVGYHLLPLVICAICLTK